MTTRNFTKDFAKKRIVFGFDSLGHLPAEMDRVEFDTAFVVSTPGRRDQVDLVAELLGDRLVGRYLDAKPHVPVSTVAQAREAVDRARPDCCIALGGGSAIGLGKAICRATTVPLVAIPTTYSGSEMTDIWGVTDGSLKTTGRSAMVVPKLIVYDPKLTLNLPWLVTASSAMNAIAHCVEAAYAPDVADDALTAAFDATQLLFKCLPRLKASPADLYARSAALHGAHLAGSALAGASMGVHHKLCHVLGGTFGLPHALTHSVTVPHSAAFNVPAAGAAFTRLAGAMGVDDVPGALFDLCRRLRIDTNLNYLGLAKTDLGRAAELTAQATSANPRPVTAEQVCVVLEDAYDGKRPRNWKALDE